MSWQDIAGQIKHTYNEQPEIFSDFTGARQNLLLSSFIVNRTEEIYDIFIIDEQSEIICHSDLHKTFSRYNRSSSYKKYSRFPQLVSYQIPEISIKVYDYSEQIETETLTTKMELHIRINERYINRLIAVRRGGIAKIAFLVSVISVLGSFLIIYLLLNPLRKLADWVSSMDRGEINYDFKMEPHTEIGEIAQAFKDVTEKFNQSLKHLADQERLQKEMQMAQEIQHSLLPKKIPQIEGYDIYCHYEAARLIGGDYYDFFHIDRDSLGIVVADVSGKGIPGSMVMTMIRQALRTEARGVYDAAEVLARLNDLIVGDMKKGMFVTVFYVIVDAKRRRLNFASAGHNPIILYRASIQKTYYLNPRGFPIGIQTEDPELFRKSIQSDTIQLTADDVLFLYTDGVTEAMNKKHDVFGEERLLRAIIDNSHLTAKEFVNTLCGQITEYTGGNPQSDDITFVFIREKTSFPREELRRAKLVHQLINEGMSIRKACSKAGISSSVYHKKYRLALQEEGIDPFVIKDSALLDVRHISIEDQRRIFDIIQKHPKYGAKRISQMLNTKKYGFTQISEKNIYNELVRSRLNTKKLRMAFDVKNKQRIGSRPIKRPGTPMLTLDGRIIFDNQLPQTKQYKADHDTGRSEKDDKSQASEEKFDFIEDLINENITQGLESEELEQRLENETTEKSRDLSERSGEQGSNEIDEVHSDLMKDYVTDIQKEEAEEKIKGTPVNPQLEQWEEYFSQILKEQDLFEDESSHKDRAESAINEDLISDATDELETNLENLFVQIKNPRKSNYEGSSENSEDEEGREET